MELQSFCWDCALTFIGLRTLLYNTLSPYARTRQCVELALEISVCEFGSQKAWQNTYYLGVRI